jgi:hypothetical protein
MDLGDKLLDKNYMPEEVTGLPSYKPQNFYFEKVIKCPVKFTNDPFEYLSFLDDYKLKATQEMVLRDLFEEDSEGNAKYNEAILIIGMRGGKSVIGGIIGSFLLHKLLAMDNPAKQLMQLPSQAFTGEYIATSEQQSKKTAYATFEKIVTRSSWWVKYLAYLKEREDAMRGGKDTLFVQHQRRIAFPEKNLEVLSLHSNSGSIAGLTAFFVCFDEMSRFDISEGDVQQQSEKRTAQAVYFTASRAAKTLKNFSKILTITSPMYETDFGMQLLYKSEIVKAGSAKNVIEALRSRYPQRVPKRIGYHYSTFEANPKTEADPSGYIESDFIAERTENYATYMRDFLAIPPAAISPFFDLPERIDQCINRNMIPLVQFKDEIESVAVGQERRNYITKKIDVINSNKVQKYFICCDQGAVKDSFAVAMGHGESIKITIPNARGQQIETDRYKVVIDFVEAWVPDKENRVTVSFQNVEDVIGILNSMFYIDRVVFDSWHSTESIERLFSKGVVTKKLSATLEMYETLKILIYSGMVELPPSNKLLNELRQLNVIKGQKIEHSSEGCFTGDTQIRLLNGTVKTLKELSDLGKDNEFWVYSCLPDGTILPAKAYNAHKTKTVTEICEVTLDTGEKVQCTPEHLFMLRNGKYKQAKELIINESLMPLYYSVHTFKYKKGGVGKYARIKNNKTNRWNWEHRYMLKSTGVNLTKIDIVHHINMKTLDNTPPNLEKTNREKHAEKHILINEKIFSKECINKRIASFKRTCKNSPDLQRKFKENGNRIFNNPSIRKKAIKGVKLYYKKNGLNKALQNYIKSDAHKINARNAVKKYFTRDVLRENANKLNNIYWKSLKGKKRRKELNKTQLVDARNKRTSNSFRKIGEGISKAADKQAFARIDKRINYVLNYEHMTRLYGGNPVTWQRRFPNINFFANAKKLEGKSLKEMLRLVGTSRKRFLMRMLNSLNMGYIVHRSNHKVRSIKLTKKEVDVYDITVPTYNNFALASGIFVHNSKDLSDAVCRVIWCVYLDGIRDAIHGKIMLPAGQRFPTIRSVADRYEMLRNDMVNMGYMQSYGIFPGSSGGSGKGVFGKSTFVEANVLPTLGDIKIK